VFSVHQIKNCKISSCFTHNADTIKLITYLLKKSEESLQQTGREVVKRIEVVWSGIQCLSFVLWNIRFLLEELGERITYFTITVLHICSTFIKESSKVLLLILRSFEGIIVYLAYIMVRLMEIKPMDPVTL
jgi:hypothetical protein